MSSPAPYNVNSDSTSNSKVQASAGQRVMAGKLNLPVSQAISLPVDLKHETLIVPASSTPAFGSFFTIDIREKNIILNNVCLQFTTSAVAGTALVGYFSPAFYWWTRIEIVQGGNVIDNVYNNSNFLLNQLFEHEVDRKAINCGAGSYDSSANRTAYSSQTTTNTVYCNLKTYFDECKINHLTNAHDVQLRVYMDTLANVFTVTSGVLTSCAINSCNAICKVTRLDSISSQQRLGDMTLRNHHNVMHDMHYMTTTVLAGNTSSNIILSAVTGNIAFLMFTVRASTVGAQAWIYSQLASFALLDSASTNLVGGQSLPASYCANILNKDWCKSQYNTETSFGTVNNGANVYIWSFSADPISAMTGQALNSKKMTGQEQLQLNFLSALTGQVQVDIYAFAENILEITPTSVKKMSL